jgi:hypothetical protein
MLDALLRYVFEHLLILLGFVIAAGVIYYGILKDSPSVDESIAHWHATIPQLTVGPTRFYDLLVSAIDRLKQPGLVVGCANLRESHALSYTRPFVRVRRGRMEYYVFAARIGESFFISSWLLVRQGVLMRVLVALPLVGWMFRNFYRFIYTETFFTYDSALHFHELMHHTLLIAVDTLTSVGYRLCR